MATAVETTGIPGAVPVPNGTGLDFTAVRCRPRAWLRPSPH